MTDFKVGDKVRVLKNAVNVPEGTVNTVVDPENCAGYVVTKEENLFLPSELKLVKPEPKFKVGDWVKVHGRHDRWDGTVGTVLTVSPKSYSHYGYLYTILRNNKAVGVDHTLRFFEGALEATEAPSKPKKGDWAKAVGYGHEGGSFEGRAGEVTQVVKLTDGSSLTTLKYPFVAGKAAQGTFDSKYIQVAEAPKPSFQVGDRVAPKQSAVSDHKGQAGTLTKVTPKSTWPFEVTYSSGVTEFFYEDEIEFAPKFATGGWVLPAYAEADVRLTAKVFGNLSTAEVKGYSKDKPAPLKIYLAGPMSGIEHYNFPAFFTAARKLRAAGHTVFNPAENDMDGGFNALGMEGHEAADHGFSLREALKTDLSWICENADALVLLEGWESSKGVRAEMALAEALGLPKYEMERLPAEVAK